MNLSKTAELAIVAYGGIVLWENSKSIEALVSASGLAFKLKRRIPFVNSKISMKIDEPYSKITAIGKDPNISGILDGTNVRLENVAGEIIEKRDNARKYFPYGRRLFYWDDLDISYFANYAFWNYFTLPKLLMNSTIKWTEKEFGVLFAEFPDDIPTHSKFQEFYFDTMTGLLLYHNYTVDIISKLATASNKVLEHQRIDNFIYPSKRLITPMNKNRKPSNFPTLLYLEIKDLKIHN